MTITSRGAVAPTSDQQSGPLGSQGAPVGVAELGTRAELDAVVPVRSPPAATPCWAGTGAAARADLLQQVITDTMAVQDEWLAAACRAEGVDAGHHRGG